MVKAALLIGVSNYEHASALKALPAARKDVEAMERVLLNPLMGNFSEVLPLFDPDPMQMQEAIEALFRGRTKDDLVLLYFSGHGVKDDNGELHFTTRLTRKTSTGELIKATAVSASVIHKLMGNSRSRRQVVILDCCFSGAFDPALHSKDDGSLDLHTQLGAEGRVVLTSSSSTQYSFEQIESELSIYTRYLVEGIETGGADRDNDSQIAARELHEYASRKVQETAPNMSPKIIVLKDEGFEIVIAKAKTSDPKLKYRKEVERYGSRGEISPVSRLVLDRQRVQLGLLDDEAVTIENDVLRPYRERLENLKQYRDVFASAMEREYPLNAETLKELEDLRLVMGLRDQDVEPIHLEVEKQIVAAREGIPQKLLQYEQEFVRVIQNEYPLSKSARNALRQLQQSLGLKDGDIDNVEIKIIEQNRYKYQANLQQYKQEFLKAIQAEYPLTQQIRQELKHFQQILGLESKDIKLLEKSIIEQKELALQKQREQQLEQERIKRQEQVKQKEIAKQHIEEQRQLQRKSQEEQQQEKQQQNQKQPSQNALASPQNRSSRFSLVSVACIAIVTVTLASGVSYWAYTQDLRKQDIRKQNSYLEQVKSLKTKEDYGQCINQAEAFTGSDQDVSTAVKALLSECQLAKGEQLAQNDHLVDAITTVGQIPSDAAVYTQAQKLMESLGNRIFELAEKTYQEGSLDTALQYVAAIPDHHVSHQKALDAVERWNTEWKANAGYLKAAQEALGKGQWQTAIATANKVVTDYWKQQAKPIIQKANDEIAKEKARAEAAKQAEAERQTGAGSQETYPSGSSYPQPSTPSSPPPGHSPGTVVPVPPIF